MCSARLSVLLLGVVISGPALADPQPVLTLEPLVLAGKNAAVQHAQRTLLEAGALLRSELDGETLPGMGLQATKYSLGELSFRNPTVVYRNDADGNRVHYGYTFQMKAGADRNAPWVNIAVGRRGRIANRLFSGTDSVFALASPHLPDGGLERVTERDLSNARALDTMTRWNARRQSKLDSMKPLVVRMPKAAGAEAKK